MYCTLDIYKDRCILCNMYCILCKLHSFLVCTVTLPGPRLFEFSVENVPEIPGVVLDD